jgi:integrase
MKAYEEWLAEQSPSTKQHYDKRMQNFLSSMGLTVEAFSDLTMKEMKHEVLEYRAKSKKDGMPQNSILAHICAVRSYCVSIEKPLLFKKNALGKVQADTKSHFFSNGDLRGLFEIGSTFEKALIATSVSLGWEISSVLELKRQPIKAKIERAQKSGEQFVFFDDTREKTGERRLATLNPLAITWLAKFLDSSKETEKLFPITEDGVNKMLKRLARLSGLALTGTIRFHNIRKWLMTQLSHSGTGFNEFHIKMLMGKAIPVSDETYLRLKNDIMENYPKVYEQFLNIYPQGIIVTDKQSKETIEGLKAENEGLKQQIEGLKIQLNSMSKSLNELLELPSIKKEIFERKEKVDVT